MFIEDKNEAVDDTVDDDNGVGVQLLIELQATIQLIRSARERRLPIRYPNNRKLDYLAY